MKAKYLFLFCCLMWTAEAQNNTIVNDNSSWTTLHYGLGAFMIPCDVSTEYVYFGGDSVIGEQLYKKVFSCNDSLRKNIKYEGLMREQNQKTYFIPKNSETEYLLYDFSLEEGMNFEYTEFRWQQSETIYVKIVDSLEINGSMKKRIQFTIDSTSEWVTETWIENMGSLYDFLYPMHKLFISGSVSKLLCFFQNDELVYKNPEYTECYYDNAEDIVTSTDITTVESCSIYPNPVNNRLILSSLNKTISFVEIFDISGHKVYSQSHGSTIDVSSFSKGMYLLKVYDNSRRVSTFKIIKK